MSGHVFIVHGDLRQFACDAWLASGGRRAYLSDRWLPPNYAGVRQGTPFVDGGPRAQLLDQGTVRVAIDPGSRDRPQLWLGRIGRRYDPNEPTAWYVRGATNFLELAARAVIERGSPPLFGRAAPLLALPVVGTGDGGGAVAAGMIVQELLPELERFVARSPTEYGRAFDVALVCFDPATHAAAQAERARAEKEGQYRWPDELGPVLRAGADALAERARHADLALFLGAGVSMPAGLPRWADLIDHLAARAGMSAEDRRELSGVRNALDQATIVERWLARKPEGLGSALETVLGGYNHSALTHTLLAALPVREVITTNYDQLFDRAWAHSDPTGISVLPDGIRPDGRRWLLKMHGCLSRPERVVLTRSSYIRYDEGLPALAGLVQGLLLTRHILFVGFSLTDDNFHRLVDGVRRLRGEQSQPAHFGTALWLGKDRLGEVLWEKDVPRVCMVEQPEAAVGFPSAVAARRLEIFLDYLVSRTRDAAHLLVGNHFDPLLSPGERAIRDALQKLADLGTGPHAQEVRDTVAWHRIERLLRGLGLKAGEG